MDRLGGFLPEDADYGDEPATKVARGSGPDPSAPYNDGPDPDCLECGKTFPFSFLYDRFSYPVCDGCKDMKEKHVLMTRSDGKDEFLLKDCDLDLRDPPLRFLSKKNPRNANWGDMKLYLRLQLHQRAMEIWGSEEGLEEAKNKRLDSRRILKQKRFEKKMKDLRRTLGDNLPTATDRAHVHRYGEELHDSDSDTYYKQCSECEHRVEYEKM